MDTKVKDLVIAMAFLAIVYGIFWADSRDFMNVFQSADGEGKAETTRIDAGLREIVSENRNYIAADIYGIACGLLGRNKLEVNFYRDSKDIMHNQISCSNEQVEDFCQQMLGLKELCDREGMALLYVQYPYHCIRNYNAEGAPTPDGRWPDDTNAEMDDICSFNSLNGINCLDLRDDIASGDLAVSDTLFKTDVHMKTEAEWYGLNKIYSILSQNGLQSDFADTVLNLDSYEHVYNDFWGNTAKSVGRHYVGTDTFLRLYPLFDTDMVFTNLRTGEIREGAFENTVMNGYDKNGDDATYFVTDYMNFMMPAYAYANRAADTGSLLIIMDSMGYRTVSYMTLLYKNITIIDPRFQGKAAEAMDYAAYDAVVVIQANGLIGCSFGIGGDCPKTSPVI